VCSELEIPLSEMKKRGEMDCRDRDPSRGVRLWLETYDTAEAVALDMI